MTAQLSIAEVVVFEVDQLRDENARLRQLLVELEAHTRGARQRAYDLGFADGQNALGLKLATARRHGEDLNTIRL